MAMGKERKGEEDEERGGRKKENEERSMTRMDK